jgi:uncharacterized protein YuzB (UPF0349 family)
VRLEDDVTRCISDIMAGVSICYALADHATMWFTPVEPSSSSQILELACMVYGCASCTVAAEAIVNAGDVFPPECDF